MIADSEETIARPFFDDESVQQARRAVPLAHASPHASPRISSWPTLVTLVVVAALAGSVIGGMALMFYQRLIAPSGTPARMVTAEAPSGRMAADTSDDAAPDEDAAAATPDADPQPAPAEEETAGRSGGEARAALRGALDEWIAATNARDIRKQMRLYNQRVEAYYLTRGASLADVRAEKARVFGRADSIAVRAGEPEIDVSPDGRTATMRFRKRYAIESDGRNRRGEVLQELRWQRTRDGWKITSERDLQVID